MSCKLLIIVLNWNGKNDTLECLASIANSSTQSSHSLLVVDNGSTDGSVAAIRAAFPNVAILETGTNLGYAGGNNAGIRWALEKPIEWILLLNNDTTIASDLFERFLEAAEEHPAAKILGATIYHADDSNRIEHLGGIWNPERAEYEQVNASQQVDMVCGCALMMHRSVPETIGLLEERFFLLWEEADFCARAKKAGFGIATVNKAKVWHKGSASFTGGKPHLQYFWWRNRLLWIARNCTPKEKRRLYLRVLLPEMAKCGKLALLKTAQTIFSSDRSRQQKARRYRAGLRGIFDYFMGRFGNCPAAYIKRR